MAELRGITTVYMPLGTAFETILALNYNSFNLTVGNIGVGIYSIEGGGCKGPLILMLEICVVTVIVKGRVLLEIPSICMHILVQYFQSRYRNEDIGQHSLTSVERPSYFGRFS